MVELIKHGVYLLDGQKVVEDTTGYALGRRGS